jgi:hypothetical protein
LASFLCSIDFIIAYTKDFFKGVVNFLLKLLTYAKIYDTIYLKNILNHIGGYKMTEDTLLTDEELEKKKKIAAVWDKITTGILIALMASPFLILGYIFHWFLTK